MADLWRRVSRHALYNRMQTTNNVSHHSTSQADLGNIVLQDSFQQEVTEKTNTYLIGKQEAENEVYIDRVISTEKDKDKALLCIIDSLDNEERVQVLLSCLLSRGANPSTHNVRGETPLHLAVKNNFKGVCKKLLDNGAWPSVRDKNKLLPFSLALSNENDDIASLLILYMKNDEVRSMFSSSEQNEAEFSLHDLLRSGKMEKTLLSILNCMIDLIGTDGKAIVHFHVLESDEKGFSPDHPNFQIKDRSSFQMIAKGGNKTLVNHDVMRLLVRSKWKHYARIRFVFSAIIFISNFVCMAFAAISAAKTDNPLEYVERVDYFRGFCEVISTIAAVTTIGYEIHHIIKQKLEYFKEKLNYLQLISSCLLIVLIPLRFTNNNSQWQVLSAVFLLWTFRIFKYASVFRQTGAYAQILVRIVKDVIQFMMLFTVFLLAFSGTLVLALRGGSQEGLDEDTSSFWAILFLGLRILIESEKIIEYTSNDPWSCIVVVMFLFCCIVLLLNLLIAQLSDSYHHIQNDAQRGLEVNRAWIVARVELRSMIKHRLRVKKYRKLKEVKDINKVLEKWESPPIQELSTNIQNIDECVGSHKLSLLSVTARLARQERSLMGIQETLDTLSKRMLSEWETNNINDNENRNNNSLPNVDDNDDDQTDPNDSENRDVSQVTFTLSPGKIPV